MISSSNYRHEQKYLIHHHDYLKLKPLLRSLLSLDPHSQSQDRYLVRSLYFDDRENSCFHDKIDGVETRKKYRLRIYDPRASQAQLECKFKQGQFVRKEKFNISRDEYNQIQQNHYHFLLNQPHPLAKQFYVALKHQGFRPVVLVEYDREAYVLPGTSVRITFDHHLRKTWSSLDLWGKEPRFEVLPGPNLIMEIKYGTYFPDYLKQVLSLAAQPQLALSKFVVSQQMMSNRV